METINEIFSKGIDVVLVKDSIIKSVNIDWNFHSTGILNIAKHLEPGYEIGEINKPILKLMLQYFTGNDEFIDGLNDLFGTDGDLSKGLMIIGGVGTGKTLLFDIFKLYTSEIISVNSFRRYNAMEIVENVSMDGMPYLQLFNGNNGYPITCYIDDISATNEQVKYYGTDINVIKELINYRYFEYKKSNKLTHMSSNKYPEELISAYGERAYDRIKEMFNFIELTGDSYRK